MNDQLSGLQILHYLKLRSGPQNFQNLKVRRVMVNRLCLVHKVH